MQSEISVGGFGMKSARHTVLAASLASGLEYLRYKFQSLADEEQEADAIHNINKYTLPIYSELVQYKTCCHRVQQFHIIAQCARTETVHHCAVHRLEHEMQCDAIKLLRNRKLLAMQHFLVLLQ